MRELVKSLNSVDSTISRTDIEQVEKKMGINIPEELKVFLESFNGVTLHPNHFSISGESSDFNLRRLNSLKELIDSYNYVRDYEEISGILPIGDTLGDGFFIGIDTNSENNGKIYIIDSALNSKVIANNLTEFLNTLVYED